MSDYLNQVRSLDHLRELVDCYQSSDATQAPETLTEETNAAVKKIVNDIDELEARVRREADEAHQRIIAEAMIAVRGLEKAAKTAAHDLLRDAKISADRKDVIAIAAGIIEEAEQAAVRLHDQAEESLAACNEEVEIDVSTIRGIADELAGVIAGIVDRAEENVVNAGQSPSLDISGVSENEDHGTAAGSLTHEASLRIINTLADCAKQIHEAADAATAKLRRTTDDAVASIRSSATEASKLIECAVDNADQQLVAATKTAVVETVGDDMTSQFEVDAYTKRMLAR